MRSTSTITLLAVDPRDVIQTFDVAYDMTAQHHRAIAMLELSRAFESEDIAIRVGASWCRIIRADVEYRTADGLAEIEATRDTAQRLYEQAKDGKDDFMRYACARWHDGAGKVFFRCGDYAEAIVHFDRAFDLVKGIPRLRHCWEDIASNRLRARYDAMDTALRQEIDQLPQEVDRTSLQKIRRTRDALVDELQRRLRDAAPSSAEAPDPATYAHALEKEAAPGDLRAREHLRGLCSLAHNLSVVLPRSARDEDVSRRSAAEHEALQWSMCSEQLAHAMGDSYRRAQAIVQQAVHLGRHTNAIAVYERILSGFGKDWRRGELIVRQNVAWINNDGATLIGMLDEYDTKLAHGDATAGLDFRMLQWTARRLRECTNDMNESYDPHAYELRAVRAVRRVVKLAHYKRLFADQMRPVFLQEAKRKVRAALDGPHTGEDPLEPVVAIVEESSARELLDLVGATVSEAPQERSDLQDDPRTDVPEAPPATEGPRRRGRTRRVSTAEERLIEIIEQQRRAWEDTMTGRPIRVRDHDADIGRALRAITAQGMTEGSAAAPRGICVVRYFEYGDQHDLGALVYSKGQPTRLVERLPVAEIRALAKRLAEQDAPGRDAALELWDLLIKPLGEVLDTEHLVIIPAGPIFQLPLHIACDGKRLLGARVPLSFSVSATAFLTGRRHLLRFQPVDPDDDLCALVPHYAVDRLSADDVDVDWPEEHFYIAGARPHGLAREKFKYAGEGDLAGLRRLASVHPEFFVYVGHGAIDADGEPLLKLQNDTVATSYALLTPYTAPAGTRSGSPELRSARLTRNKWTILAGCVTGQQADLAGGEVAGFVRAFTAVGAGALVLALWHVLSKPAAETTRALLSSARKASGGTVDIVHELKQHYAAQGDEKDIDGWIERCPFVVYL